MSVPTRTLSHRRGKSNVTSGWLHTLTARTGEDRPRPVDFEEQRGAAASLPPGVRARQGRPGGPWREPLRRIGEAIEQRPGATAGEVASATGIARPTVAATLGKLARDGELEKSELPGGGVGYRTAPAEQPAEPSAAGQDGDTQSAESAAAS